MAPCIERDIGAADLTIPISAATDIGKGAIGNGCRTWTFQHVDVDLSAIIDVLRDAFEVIELCQRRVVHVIELAVDDILVWTGIEQHRKAAIQHAVRPHGLRTSDECATDQQLVILETALERPVDKNAMHSFLNSGREITSSRDFWVSCGKRFVALRSFSQARETGIMHENVAWQSASNETDFRTLFVRHTATEWTSTVRILLIVGLAFFGFANPSSAADDVSTAQTIIQSQADALSRDDAAAAYGYAAPQIQSVFSSADTFISMVKTSYPPIYRHKTFEFGKVKAEDGKVIQEVHITDTDGVPWDALYTLEHQADGSFKISGCLLVKVGQAA